MGRMYLFIAKERRRREQISLKNDYEDIYRGGRPLFKDSRGSPGAMTS